MMGRDRRRRDQDDVDDDEAAEEDEDVLGRRLVRDAPDACAGEGTQERFEGIHRQRRQTARHDLTPVDAGEVIPG